MEMLKTLILILLLTNEQKDHNKYYVVLGGVGENDF